MSERIIQALLRLFAVFAKTEVDKSDKIKIVELFLANQLNKELAKKYLPSFEQEYDEVRNDISRITEKASLKEDLDAEKIKFKIEAKLSARIHKSPSRPGSPSADLPVSRSSCGRRAGRC